MNIQTLPFYFSFFNGLNNRAKILVCYYLATLQENEIEAKSIKMSTFMLSKMLFASIFNFCIAIFSLKRKPLLATQTHNIGIF
jgi:hypothetical protein